MILFEDFNLDGVEDFNLDGVEDSKDANLVNVGQTLGWNALSRANNTAGAYNGNRKSYAGYESSFFDHSTMHVRHRVYLAEMGRWSRRDPIGYTGGMNVYGYAEHTPIAGTDPSGLCMVKFDCTLVSEAPAPSQLCGALKCKDCTYICTERERSNPAYTPIGPSVPCDDHRLNGDVVINTTIRRCNARWSGSSPCPDNTTQAKIFYDEDAIPDLLDCSASECRNACDYSFDLLGRWAFCHPRGLPLGPLCDAAFNAAVQACYDICNSWCQGARSRGATPEGRNNTRTPLPLPGTSSGVESVEGKYDGTKGGNCDGIIEA